jgi:cobalt-zinc-cadmium efflux system outer membrane protein
LTHTPELQTARTQRGIAAAGLVIAQTYPFNPVWDFKVQQISGPAPAGITNVVGTEQVVLLEIELRHQKRYRKQGAAAALTRVDWEIAAHEVQVAVRVARAFDTVVYRRAKLELLADTLVFREHAAKDARRRAGEDKSKRTGVLLAEVDVSDVRSQLVASRVALTVAQSELARALGCVHDLPAVVGTQEITVPPADTEALVAAAIEARPEMHARRAALDEADARLRLEIANRYGSPLVGTDYEYDPTRISFSGVHVTLPLPVFNTHRGEIQQRQAERVHVAQELCQVEQQITQEVEAAVARLRAALVWEQSLRKDLLPEIQADVAEAERLAAEPKVGDTAGLVELRQRLLKTRDLHLDALWEISQARADLAAALGDPQIAIGAPACR